mgnify:FL=1
MTDKEQHAAALTPEAEGPRVVLRFIASPVMLDRLMHDADLFEQHKRLVYATKKGSPVHEWEVVYKQGARPDPSKFADLLAAFRSGLAQQGAHVVAVWFAASAPSDAVEQGSSSCPRWRDETCKVISFNGSWCLLDDVLAIYGF